VQYGQVVRDFLDHLVARQPAVRERGRADRGYLYHLRAKSLYRALGQEDNRNRRPVSLAATGRKLMLDFVIAHPDVPWAATEDDKAALCTAELGLSSADLPHQIFTAADPMGTWTIWYFSAQVADRRDAEPRRLQLVALPSSRRVRSSRGSFRTTPDPSLACRRGGGDDPTAAR